MKDLYNEEFLGHILFGLSNDIENLEEWSVYNDDKCLDEIIELKEQFNKIAKQLNFT